MATAYGEADGDKYEYLEDNRRVWGKWATTSDKINEWSTIKSAIDDKKHDAEIDKLLQELIQWNNDDFQALKTRFKDAGSSFSKIPHANADDLKAQVNFNNTVFSKKLVMTGYCLNMGISAKGALFQDDVTFGDKDYRKKMLIPSVNFEHAEFEGGFPVFDAEFGDISSVKYQDIVGWLR